jgi:DNA-binding response OmpR family regulator
MAPLNDASAIRVALIDDDSGLVTVLDRRFAALRWEREVLGYAPGPDQLAAMRLHALIVNPALTGLDYIERIAMALPGLALLVCSAPAPVADRVRALRGGADDWLTKPCHPEELVARIQAVLRRRRAGEVMAEDTAIVAGELSIRPDRFDAYVGPQAGSLSRKEYELLYQLAAADGRVLEREEIYQRVWGYTMVRGDRSVDVFVRKLRQKLERLSPGWRYVHTHFGVGYRFDAQPEDPGAVPAPAVSEPASAVAQPAPAVAQPAPAVSQPSPAISQPVPAAAPASAPETHPMADEARAPQAAVPEFVTVR